MNIASEFVLAETKEAQAAVIERAGAGKVRKELRQWALRCGRAALNEGNPSESALWEQAAAEAWGLREQLDDLGSGDDPVVFEPYPALFEAVNEAAEA